jgi:hypothetical protein
MSIFYWAYGSNLDPSRMRQRCPSARKVGPLTFNNAALVFRAVADVEMRKGSTVQGGLWEISAADERTLDRFEGVAQGLYSRWHVQQKVDGVERDILFYKMNEEGVMPPSMSYIDTIMRGYQAFGLDLKPLDEALSESHDDKNKTEYLQWRFKRDRPRLAKREHIRLIVKPLKPIQPVQREFKLYGEARLIKAADKLKAVEPVRYIRNIDGTSRVIQKAKPREYVLPTWSEPSEPKSKKRKRHNKGKGRNYKLSMKGW